MRGDYGILNIDRRRGRIFPSPSANNISFHVMDPLCVSASYLSFSSFFAAFVLISFVFVVFALYFFYALVGASLSMFLIFSRRADHVVPDWQPLIILLGMVETLIG